MANYEDNRIRCSAETAMHLIVEDDRDYYSPIDFRKALGMAPESQIDHDVAYSDDINIEQMEDGTVDIGFCTRWYSNLNIIQAFVTKYPDAEWWINQDDVDIFHYYWQDGEVIEDTHHVTDEEDEYLNDFSPDDTPQYRMIFTEKQDQEKYVNFHPVVDSAAYREYLQIVDRIAHQIVEEDRYFTKAFDYQWRGEEKHFNLSMGIRAWYLYKSKEDFSNYKLNIMSSDVLDAVQRLVFPYDKILYDAVFGLAIGDALGVPYEFMKRGTFKCTGMIGYGSHDQPAGTWSDDTSMTLATLKSLRDNNGKVVVDDIKKNFLAWLYEGKFTAHGELFDIGHSTLKALRSGVPRTGEFENGNGSLMRILPLAFVDCSDDDIRAVSAITHGHWISQEACVIYVHVARRLIAGEKMETIIPTLIYDKPFDRLCRINELKACEIKSSGYVVDTLEAALWAVGNETFGRRDYGNDVLRAVNLGEDTDTVGAVTGGLAGILYGLGYDGEKWLEALQNKEEILDCLWI